MHKASWLLVIPVILALAVGVAVFAVGARAVDRGFDVIEYRQQSPYYQALALRDATMQDGGGFSWGRLFLMVAAVIAGGAWALGRVAPFLREWRLTRRKSRRAPRPISRLPSVGSLPALPPGDFDAERQRRA
jgi:hypothetical protein